jgi:hypothetical protein
MISLDMSAMRSGCRGCPEISPTSVVRRRICVTTYLTSATPDMFYGIACKAAYSECTEPFGTEGRYEVLANESDIACLSQVSVAVGFRVPNF